MTEYVFAVCYGGSDYRLPNPTGIFWTFKEARAHWDLLAQSPDANGDIPYFVKRWPLGAALVADCDYSWPPVVRAHTFT